MIEELFGDFDVKVEEIPLNDEQARRNYALSLFERVKITSKSTPESQKEVVEAFKASKQLTCISFELEKEVQDHQFCYDPTEMVTTLNFVSSGLIIPVPKAEFADKWIAEAKAYLEYLVNILEKTQNKEELQRDSDGADVNYRYSNEKYTDNQVLSVRLIRTIMLYEAKLKEALKKFTREMENKRVKYNYVTGGLWVLDVKKKPAEFKTFLPLTNKTSLKHRDMNHLVNLCFSSKPHIIAKAKIELSATLDFKIMNSIIEDPRRQLIISLTEANLTPIEVVATVFPYINEGHMCPRCETSVKIGSDIFHKKCSVMRWIDQYLPFIYNEETQCISAVKYKQLTKSQRDSISQLLELHHKLNNDIIISDDKGILLWKRKENGEFEKHRIDAPFMQVGSQGWRRTRGISPFPQEISATIAAVRKEVAKSSQHQSERVDQKTEATASGKPRCKCFNI